ASGLSPDFHYTQDAKRRPQGLLLGTPQETSVGTPGMSSRCGSAEQHFRTRDENEINSLRAWTGRLVLHAADKSRADRPSSNRQGARTHRAADAARDRRRGDRIS